jgi:hypothetical protein
VRGAIVGENLSGSKNIQALLKIGEKVQLRVGVKGLIFTIHNLYITDEIFLSSVYTVSWS